MYADEPGAGDDEVLGEFVAVAYGMTKGAFGSSELGAMRVALSLRRRDLGLESSVGDGERCEAAGEFEMTFLEVLDGGTPFGKSALEISASGDSFGLEGRAVLPPLREPAVPCVDVRPELRAKSSVLGKSSAGGAGAVEVPLELPDAFLGRGEFPFQVDDDEPEVAAAFADFLVSSSGMMSNVLGRGIGVGTWIGYDFNLRKRSCHEAISRDQAPKMLIVQRSVR